MKISTRSQYGLRAMVYLARFSVKNKVYPLKIISKNEGISFDYLEKIISQLEKRGLVKAKKGARGGYFLARNPQKIKVGEIIRALEGTLAPVGCVAKEKDKKYNCPRKKICRTFGVWKMVKDSLNTTLDSIVLTDLIKK